MDQRQKEIEAFQELVDSCASSKSDVIIHNASFEHAKVLIRKLLSVALRSKQRIRIVSGSLDASVYGDLQKELAMCIGAGVQIEAIVLDTRGGTIGENLFAKTLIENGLLSEPARPIADGLGFSHFIVVGEEAFRLESDPRKVEAIGSFANSSIGKTLASLFDNLKRDLHCRPILA